MLVFFEGGGGILNSEGMDYPRILNSGGVAAGGSSILSAWGLTHSPTHPHTHTPTHTWAGPGPRGIGGVGILGYGGVGILGYGGRVGPSCTGATPVGPLVLIRGAPVN